MYNRVMEKPLNTWNILYLGGTYSDGQVTCRDGTHTVTGHIQRQVTYRDRTHTVTGHIQRQVTYRDRSHTETGRI